VVGMDMRVDHIADFNLGFAGFFDEPVFVTRDDIHGDGLAQPRTAEEVRQG